ncbi:hypothetical protein M569_05025 [Genlisea aurea]|uniref:SEC7 domain-containing protein n=1 Tax=Genlisea aurea TaxID=192259 RepID=S8CXI2_9LAMI|nr:hypothetical protein M569_05025 [Genlisea aurea]
MSSAQTLGGASRCGWVLGPSLDKIIKNAAWRKHSNLVSACKSVLDKLESLADIVPDPASCTPIYGISPSEVDFLLQPLIMAIESGSPKVVEPALDCAFRLFSFGIIRGCEVKDDSSIIFRLVDCVCKCSAFGEESVELSVLKVLLSAVRSPNIHIRGECLNYIVRSCYNIYLGSRNGTNQICAKSVLAQMMIIVFTRAERNSVLATFNNVVVFEMLEFTDRNLNEGSSVHFSQNFINEIVEAKQSPPDMVVYSENIAHHMADESGEKDEHSSDVPGLSVCSEIREDAFTLFKNLCKLSMKFSLQEYSDDQILLRGNILSLELLNVIMANAGPIWRTSERFLGAVKQFLCLSLLKNSGQSVMTIFQLLCSIFYHLISKFRSGLKSEIGIFFPMLILRVLENVLHPNFLQKMTVISLVEKIVQDPQIIIDIFVNYDCDVEAPNLFERTVNGLLKTALGPPTGSSTTLSTAQDSTFRHESVSCLVGIIRSMASWMDQQLKAGDINPLRCSDNGNLVENASPIEDATVSDSELHSESNLEFSDTASLEQRRAHKLEIQKGIALFNRKPSKGIEFLVNAKKISSSPEDVATFLKTTSGLNESTIGDYIGERDDFAMRVMHAYVDSFDFGNMGFADAIRFFLKGFRLPGEAQKIDRIMEKFAERYCKCNPNSFTSADSAYVLAYSVIMLNTDAHNNMVKDKMTKADFIRNNRGIDGGKDLPEDYLGMLYDQIVKNEIKLNVDSCLPQSKQGNSLNKLLGMDGILNLVWKQADKPLGANENVMRYIREQFKAKSSKPEDIYYSVSDTAILRFMVEVCWGPMLAAFSVTLGQSNVKEDTSLCLSGFRFAVHITAVMGLQTEKDAFFTSVAKFTYLHCAADMKQKNIDAVKAIISIAIEDGNFLQEAWEHVLTCLSRFEHLQLLGEGAPLDASFLRSTNSETEEKAVKPLNHSSFKKKEALQNPAVVAVVRGGSYDSTSNRVDSSGLVTTEQMSNFISNLHLLEQIGSFELNQIFAHSQRLNSEAIVHFVKALCKVAISELQSPTDPRVFSLTKMVEVAHYNMNRIRLVWSRIWIVLSEFFVAVGLSKNLSVAIFVMDSLRQLAMKFLEREELANYNFQNEFLRPFVVVIQKSSSTEIRELIVRCISQMVLVRFNNIKSGWKSVFLVFTVAAADKRKSIVMLAFETMEKIVREYFSYITEAETLTFTDCVRCLIMFTKNRFNSDVSLNAIAFLRYCAVKLAEGGVVVNQKDENDSTSVQELGSNKMCIADDDYSQFWDPLLSGLSELTSDARQDVQKGSLEVLFDILKDHGHLFDEPFWSRVFNSVVFPIFRFDYDGLPDNTAPDDSRLNALAAELLTDLFVQFFDLVRDHLKRAVSILVDFIKTCDQEQSNGVAALMRLVVDLRAKLSEEECRDIFICLKEAVASCAPDIMKLLKKTEKMALPESPTTATALGNSVEDPIQKNAAAYILSRLKNHISIQLLLLQVVTNLYNKLWPILSHEGISVVLGILSSATAHSHELRSETRELVKLEKASSSSVLDTPPEPPAIQFENEAYENYLNLVHHLYTNNPSFTEENQMEAELIAVCEKILRLYIDSAGGLSRRGVSKRHVVLPLGAARKEELVTRTSLASSVMRILDSLESRSFGKYADRLFPLLVDLVRSQHTSPELQRLLSGIFRNCIGPIIMR